MNDFDKALTHFGIERSSNGRLSRLVPSYSASRGQRQLIPGVTYGLHYGCSVLIQAGREELCLYPATTSNPAPEELRDSVQSMVDKIRAAFGWDLINPSTVLAIEKRNKEILKKIESAKKSGGRSS